MSDDARTALAKCADALEDAMNAGALADGRQYDGCSGALRAARAALAEPVRVNDAEPFPVIIELPTGGRQVFRRHEALRIRDALAVALAEPVRTDEDIRREHFAQFLEQRGVETPCGRCGGFGTRTYGSGSTWRGGPAGQVCTLDVCDKCWGSGDAERPGANLRALKNARTYEDGVREERARVVAAIRNCVVVGRAWTEEQAVASKALLDVADRIERGEHA